LVKEAREELCRRQEFRRLARALVRLDRVQLEHVRNYVTLLTAEPKGNSLLGVDSVSIFNASLAIVKRSGIGTSCL
jgi:hypothetical protein